MTALVTGAAGFIGSNLCQLLLDEGLDVRGVDCFTDYYPRLTKLHNVDRLQRRKGFHFVEADLSRADIPPLLIDVDTVYHLAGQPGVRSSWGEEFSVYLRHNILATQRLLESSRRRSLRKFVFASSSSVYGDAESYPTSESARPEPVSPYGVTKLAAEHLCEVYRRSFGLPVAALRLFTVYGPGQRPDMAFARLVHCALTGGTFELLGDGSQTRDFTYVADVTRAMVDVAASDWCGVANIGGGARTSMAQVLQIVEALCGPLSVWHSPTALGDVRHTSADTRLAQQGFGYRPTTSLADGLAHMVASLRLQSTELVG
jgi:nucleoside-diphosphate-sugar epimerase